MRKSTAQQWRGRLQPHLVVLAVVALLAALLGAANVGGSVAEAQGPPYSGPQTGATGPAYFGPAPNPVPYCESPTYFDPFPENVSPIGRIDVAGTPNASVTTDGITMDFEITAEGDPGGQYPGFFPAGGEGVANDQPKGVEMAAGDEATVTLSAPLFYSQWVFTDVDRQNEGFFVTPAWTDPDAQIAIFAGDPSFEFDGSSNVQAAFNDTDTVGLDSQDIGGRVQVDMLGAVTGISMQRDVGSGQSGFAVGGGCEAAGAAKVLAAGPTWNGSSFDVTFELRVRNNLPSGSTVAAAILAAQANAPADFLSGAPEGIPLRDLQLVEPLADSAFSDISIVRVSNPAGILPLNPSYDGIGDTNLLAGGASLTAETDELITLELQYTPDLAQVAWSDCANGYTYLNQATVTATAANVAVSDQSDDGLNPAPGNDNGIGGVDDVTEVVFPCPPADLEIVKTVVAGPNGACPDFAGGIVGDGPTLNVTDQDTVTYCISVANPATFSATNVVISDSQNPDGAIAVGTLAGQSEQTFAYDLVVDLNTPSTNTATATGDGPNGALPSVSDTAVIAIAPLPVPELSIVKTVVPGPNGVCPDFDDGIVGAGTALAVEEGDTVTYCLSVRNSGAGDASNVVVTDPQAPAAFDGTIGTLAAGGDAGPLVFDLTVTLLTPPLNTATVTGDGPYGAVAPDTDDALIDVSARPDPALAIVKTAIAGPAGACPAFADGVIGAGAALAVVYGETVTYCISVMNQSGSDATNVVVTDAQAPVGFDGDLGTIPVGQERTLSYDLEVDAATPALNTAVVNGSGPNGPVPADSDQAVIDPMPQPDPVLQIVKTVVVGPGGTCPASVADGVDGLGVALPVLFGDTVTYCLNVRNDAGTDATGVLISDPQAPVGFDGAVGDLAVGAEAVRSFDLAVDATTPEINTAGVGGSGPNGPVPGDSDQAVIDPMPQPDPVLQIVKTVVVGPGGTCPASVADGVDGLGVALPVLFGDTVTYCLNVRNDAGTDATGVLISDPQAPVGFDGAVGDLAVGAEAVRSFDLVIDAATPEVNTATVSGVGPNGAVPGDTDQARIVSSPQPDPILDIVKTVVPGPNGVCPGYEQGVQGVGPALAVLFDTTVTYCLSIFNGGLSAATNVVISDIQAPAGFDGFIGDLGVASERTLSFDKLVDEQTPVLNTARVDGEGPNGPVAPDSDQAAIQPALAPEPRLEIIKTVVLGPNGSCPTYDNGIQGVGPALAVLYGQTVTYCISVINEGLNTATDVVIRDVQAPGTFDGAVGTLVVGAEATRSFDLTIGPATPEVNTALVSGNGPNGPVPGDSDTAQISSSPLPEPVLDIVKTVIAGPGGVCPAFEDGVEGVGAALEVLFGETVTYCLSVRNNGLGAATNVAVIDSHAPEGFDGAIGELSPGQEATLVYDVVVDEDTPAVNIAMVTGDGPNGPVDADTDLARIDASPVLVPQLSIVKTAIEGPAGTCPSFDDGVVGIGPGLEVMVTDAVTYCISVRNVGDGAATNVVINDPQADAEIVVGDLAAGATFDTTYDVTVTEATPLINTAVASGQGPEGSVNAEDSAQIVATEQLIPSITLTNTVVPINESCNDAVESVDEFVLGAVGDGVRWCFEVSNTGNTSLTDLVFDDPPLGLVEVDVLADHGNGGLSLPPGASIRFSSDGAIPQDGVVSLSSIVATPSDAAGNPLGDLDPVSDQNDAAVDEAGIRLVKLVAAGADADCGTAIDDLEVNAGASVT